MPRFPLGTTTGYGCVFACGYGCVYPVFASAFAFAFGYGVDFGCMVFGGLVRVLVVGCGLNCEYVCEEREFLWGSELGVGLGVACLVFRFAHGFAFVCGYGVAFVCGYDHGFDCGCGCGCGYDHGFDCGLDYLVVGLLVRVLGYGVGCEFLFEGVHFCEHSVSIFDGGVDFGYGFELYM
jgi:hypothetical protein